MTDEQLREQVKQGVAKAIARADEEAGEELEEQLLSVVVAAYLSGLNQAAAYMVRKDGEVTAQQIERAVKKVGKEAGFKYISPR